MQIHYTQKYYIFEILFNLPFIINATYIFITIMLEFKLL